MSQSPARFRELAAFTRDAMPRYRVPGIALGIVAGDDEHMATFGVTSAENPLPVDADTLFQIGSTTKTITGTVVMRLVEAGKLDLDTPLRAYLPDLRLADEGVAQAVTPRHLLTHTGSWVGDTFDDTGWGDDALSQMVGRMDRIPQVMPLGDRFSYNNAGFYLAGRLIEVATGESYEKATHRLLLDPLGMTRSFFFPSQAMSYRFAVGHIAADGPPKVARPWELARNANPVGGLASSVTDQLRYARFHLGDGAALDGARLLSAATMQAMQTPLLPMDSFGGWRGITWAIRAMGGVTTVAHGGATNGQMSAFLLAPSHGFAVTVLTNADTGGQLQLEVVKEALRLFLGIDEPPPAHQTLSEAQLAEYAGRYAGALANVEVSVQDGQLMLQAIPNGGFPYPDSPPGPTPPPVRVAFVGPDHILALDPPNKDVHAEFQRDPAGRVAWLHFGGRARRRVEP